MITGNYLHGNGRQTIVMEDVNKITTIEAPEGLVTISTIPKGEIRVINIQPRERRKKNEI